MKKILGFEINTSPLTALGDVRSFSVQGEDQAVFSIQVKDVSNKFYNFKTQAFTTTFTSENTLKNKTIQGEEFSGTITFPASASVDTYTIYIFAEPHFETEIDEGSNSGLLTTIIEQVPNYTLTFTAKPAVTTPFATMPTSATSAGSPLSTSTVTKSIDWDINANSTDLGGFGIILTRQPVDTDWYFTTQDTVNISSPKTDTVNGTVSSSTAVRLDTSYITTGIVVGDFVYGTGVTNGTTVTAVNVDDNVNDITLSAAMSISDGVTLTFVTPIASVVVDSLTDLCVGMHVSAVSAGSLSGEPIITAIDTNTNTLTLSSTQTFADGITLTFQARGSEVIYRAIGASITFPSAEDEVGKFTTVLEPLTKVVRTTASGTTVNLNGTYGISGGSVVTVTGIGFINTSTNTVQSVSASSSAGSMVMQVAQTIRAGAKLYFEGSSMNSTTTGSILINKYPTANREIFLNVNNILATGTAS